MRSIERETSAIKLTVLCLLLLVLLPASGMARDLGISGDYVEARTSDVYTGPCFANSEVNLAGKEAILAWRVTSGGWDGIGLEGLGVVAVVRARATLGDPHSEPLPARSVLVVDEAASAEQRQALVAFARTMADGLLDEVVAVETAPVAVEVAADGFATVEAGQLAVLRTRGLNEHDHLCGNEEIYYLPLTGIEGATPAVTLEHSWSGGGLNATWKSPNKRSAFVGSFAR